ncbi:MAG TPA: SMP-30/gluconolactonase/LRE family protein [Acidothermaceae bacterium]|jgi:sugar lactone lactonase YvrE
MKPPEGDARFHQIATGFAFLEAPRWHDDKLYISDFYARRVITSDADGTIETVCEVPQRPSGLGFEPSGAMLVVSMLDHRILRLTPAGLEEVADVSSYVGGPVNDMLVDTRGRAYVGNYGSDTDAGEPERATSLVRVDPDGTCTVVADDLWFPNGMAITSDGLSLVVAESLACRISAFDLADDGSLSNRRIWAEFQPQPSEFTFADAHGGTAVVPDGVCLDANDGLWVTNSGGKTVVRVEEGGKVTDVIDCGEGTPYAAELTPDGESLYLCMGPSFGSYDPQTDLLGELWKVDLASRVPPR